MSAPRPAPNRAPLSGSIATGIAITLTAMSMTPVFSGVAWLIPVLGVSIAVLGVGIAFRLVEPLRRSGLAVVVQALAGAQGIAMVSAGGTMVLGVIPTPSTPGAVLASLTAGLDDIYVAAAPAHPTAGMIAVVMALFALVTVLIDGLVTDLRAPKPAGFLLLVVYLIPVALAAGQLSWHHFLLIGLAFVILLTSSHLPSWRQGIPWSVIAAGSLALLIAVLVPLLLPQPGVRPASGDRQDDITVVNPFLDLRDNLDRDENAVVLQYRTTDDQPAPLRLTSVQDFDGETWAPNPFPVDPYAVANDGLPTPPGLSAALPRSAQQLEVQIIGLDQNYLPTPYPPERTEGIPRSWIYDEASLSIVGNGQLTSDLQYTVDYLDILAGPEELRALPSANAAEFSDELALPDSLAASVGDLAEEVTAGEDNDFDRALALQEHFRSGAYEYTLDAPAVGSSDAIADFLDERRGYCVQFSSAMTVMARHLGIPARIAVGFTAGQQLPDGSYEVTLHNAHAWPEIYLEGAGWVRFEPSPPGVSSAPQWSDVDEDEDEGADEDETSETPTPEEPETPTPEEPETSAPDAQAGQGSEGAVATFDRLVPVILGILGVLLVIALLLAPACLRLRRRAGRRRIGSPDGLWTEVEDTLLDHGTPLDPADTLERKGRLLDERRREQGVTSGANAAILAGAAGRQRYAEDPPEESRSELLASLDGVRALQRAEHGPLRRLLAFLMPRSLLRRGASSSAERETAAEPSSTDAITEDSAPRG